ncbi:MAG: hypothetical protein INR69_01610 [Mucilaginibacter polytrichastri]|nr:hypothetical protein [Mucilaginibacter polytrichastri]
MKNSLIKLFSPLFFVAIAHFQADAQFNDLLNKAKQKAGKKAERAVDKVMNGKQETASAETNSDDNVPAGNKITINSAFDFRSGDSLIVNDNFSGDAEGKMAKGWKTNGSGAVISSPELAGKWLELRNSSTFKLERNFRYPEKFTIEFDLIAVADQIKDIGRASFGFASDNSVRSWISDAYNDGAVNNIGLDYMNGKGTTQSSGDTKYHNTTDFDLRNYANQVMHVSIAVDGQNQQVYLDKQKISDTKMFSPNRLKYFYISAPLTMKNESKLLFGNYKMTTFKN